MTVIKGAKPRVGFPTAEHSAANLPSAGGLYVARGRYDFASDGGAVGAIGLMGATNIPAGAVILGGFLDVITPPTSGGAATISVGAEGAADLVAAAAISGAPWSTAGRKSLIPVFTGASSVKATAARDISITIATAALTAGVFDVYLFYIPTV